MKRTTVALIGGAVLLLAGMQGTAWAQRAGDRVLEDVDIHHAAGCNQIRVGFRIPVRYVKHFPFEVGDEVRIQFEAIAFNPVDSEELLQRESIRAVEDNPADLVDVVYEGDIVGGPYLSLRFSHPMVFEVGQGADFRSISLAVRDSGSSLPCSLR